MPPYPKKPRTGVEVNMRTDEAICGADVFNDFIELDAPSPWTKVCLPNITGQVTFTHCHARHACQATMALWIAYTLAGDLSRILGVPVM